MTALSAQTTTPSRGNVKLTKYLLGTSAVCYAGGLVMLESDGYAYPAGASASNKGVVGVCDHNVSQAAGDTYVEVAEGEFLLTSSGLAQSNVLARMYASDDQTVALSDGGNYAKCGQLIQVVSATQGWVRISPVAPS